MKTRRQGLGTEISRLRERASAERARAIASLVQAIAKEEVRYLSPQIDDEKTSYEKGIDKEYVFSDSEDFSDEFTSLIELELVDYGIDDTTGTLIRDAYDRGREMSLVAEWAPPQTIVALRGAFFGSAGSFENLGDGLKATFKLVGVPTSHALALYEELLVEGFCMERVSRRLALFCYFSAAECVLIDLVDAQKQAVPSELHYHLERLSISDKVRIVGRATVPGGDVAKVEIWSVMLDALQATARIRNNIAHPHDPYSVTASDVDQAFLAFLLLHSILVGRKTTALDVIRTHFKKDDRAKKAKKAKKAKNDQPDD